MFFVLLSFFSFWNVYDLQSQTELEQNQHPLMIWYRCVMLTMHVGFKLTKLQRFDRLMSEDEINAALFSPRSQFRRCLLQLLCSRLSWLQRSLKERPLAPVERPIRPIVMSQACSSRNRPKKKVTFSSSSIVFIITSDDFRHLDVTSKTGDSAEVNVIQVRPLWSTRTGPPPTPTTTQNALGTNMQLQTKTICLTSAVLGHQVMH